MFEEGRKKWSERHDEKRKRLLSHLPGLCSMGTGKKKQPPHRRAQHPPGRVDLILREISAKRLKVQGIVLITDGCRGHSGRF